MKTSHVSKASSQEDVAGGVRKTKKTPISKVEESVSDMSDHVHVLVRTTHPAKMYYRFGYVFVELCKPFFIPKGMKKELQADPWLVVSEGV